MTADYDPQGTTIRHHAISHEEAQEMERDIDRRQREHRAAARLEIMATMSMIALGVLAALGIWKVSELIGLSFSHIKVSIP